MMSMSAENLTYNRQRLDEFWQWFVKHTAHINDALSLDPNDTCSDDTLFSIVEMNDLFEMVTTDITYRIQLADQDTEDNALVITAEGYAEHFPLVSEIAQSAPEIPGWKVVSFKPPEEFPEKTIIQFKEHDVCLTEIKCAVTKSNNQFAVTLWIPGFEDRYTEEFMYGATMALDAVLGEYYAGLMTQSLLVLPPGVSLNVKCKRLDRTPPLDHIERRFGSDRLVLKPTPILELPTLLKAYYQ